MVENVHIVSAERRSFTYFPIPIILLVNVVLIVERPGDPASSCKLERL